MMRSALVVLGVFVGACGQAPEGSPFEVHPGSSGLVASTGTTGGDTTEGTTDEDSSAGTADGTSADSEGGGSGSTSNATTDAMPSPVCGDGQVDEGEECDDGNIDDTDACLNSCKAATCGDSIVQEGVEQCDSINLKGTSCEMLGLPGGQLNCSNLCQFDVSGCTGKCGDGEVDPGEQCDDGNQIDTDACLNSCKAATCGDSIVQEGVEECDKGVENQVNGPCTLECKNAVCGDGHVYPQAEECDDGNLIDDDGCSNTCLSAYCGDGKVNNGEQCDDGNQVEDDACSNACKAN